MCNIIELNNRCEYSEVTDFCCGPANFAFVTAEMEIEYNGDIVYLEAEWDSEAPEELYYSANKNSLYEYKTLKKEADKNFEKLKKGKLEEFFSEKKMKKSKFSKQYFKLKQMILDKLEEEDIEAEFA